MARLNQAKTESATSQLIPGISNQSRRPAHQFDGQNLRLWRRYNDCWIPEVLALTITWSCVVSSAVILKIYDGKPNPSLHLGLTLNALISILATASKVSLIFAISNSLGQLKWIWFLGDQPRSLLDAEIYDNASRGPLGALTMLGSRPRNSVASVGAILILFALAYDPFVQQIIQFQAVLQPGSELSGAAVVSQAKFFNASDASQPAAINAALWTNDFDWKTTCTSATCTWPTFESLVWHSNCFEDKNWTLFAGCNFFNTTKSWTYNCSAITYNPLYGQVNGSIVFPLQYEIDTFYLPNTGDAPEMDYYIGVDLSGPYVTVAPLYVYPVISYSSENPGESISTDPEGFWTSTPLLSIATFYLQFERDASIALHTHTCELDLRVEEYGLATTNNSLNITTTGSYPLQKLLNERWTRNFSSCKTLYLRPNPPMNVKLFTGLDLPADNSSLIMTNDTDPRDEFCYQYSAVNDWLVALHDDLSFQGINSTKVSWSGPNNTFNIFKNTTALATLGGSRRPSSLSNDYDLAYHWFTTGPDRLMKNTAAALTQTTMDPSQNVNSTIPVHGYAEIAVTIVHVAWFWLILPYGLCFAGTIFFLITVYASRKAEAPLWKSSINAFFYHGIDYDWGTWRSLSTINDMDAEAEVTRVRLAPVGLSKRLMLEKQVISPNYDE